MYQKNEATKRNRNAASSNIEITEITEVHKFNKSQKMHEGKTKGDGAIHDHQKHEKHHVY
jgi:hypothetical protein